MNRYNLCEINQFSMKKVLKCKSQIKHHFYKIFNQYRISTTLYFSYKSAWEMVL